MKESRSNLVACRKDIAKSGTVRAAEKTLKTAEEALDTMVQEKITHPLGSMLSSHLQDWLDSIKNKDNVNVKELLPAFKSIHGDSGFADIALRRARCSVCEVQGGLEGVE